MSADGRIAVQGRAALLASLLAVALAGCSSGGGDTSAWYNYTMVENIAGKPQPTLPASLMVSSSGASAAGGQVAMVAPALVGGPTADAELYRSEASCGGVMPGASGPGAAASTIALEMTECDVVRRAGAPDKVEIGSTARGDRILILSYTRGERPRVYRFAAGRLMGIEMLPPPARPTASAKKR